MIVKTDLDPVDVWKLCSIAERQGFTTVGEMLAAHAQTLLADPPPVPDIIRRPAMVGRERVTYDQTALKAAIHDMHAERMTDAEMAARLGCSAETVRKYRTDMGLPTSGRIGRPRVAVQL